jgi:hypothetical protein
MAATDAYTTAFYECGIHEFIPEEGEQNPAVYAFNFDQPSSDGSLVLHGCELNYLFSPESVNYPSLATQM